MKYVDYKNELQSPKIVLFWLKSKLILQLFLLNESDHPSYANLVELEALWGFK